MKAIITVEKTNFKLANTFSVFHVKQNALVFQIRKYGKTKAGGCFT